MKPTEWLMENAGPVIRYRTNHELLGQTSSIQEKELLDSKIVQRWLKYLTLKFRAGQLHNAKPDAFENTMGKLFEFGLRRGMKPLDKHVKPFIDWLKNDTHWFSKILISGFLCMTGYSDENSVDIAVQTRLETVYDYVKYGDLDEIYIEPDAIGKIPVNFRGRPILNPELRSAKGISLPSIHDIHAFLHSNPVMKDKTSGSKTEKIIKFILSKKYQSLYPDYGVLYEPETRKFYGMGWSLHLADYFKDHPYSRAMKKSICIDHSNLLRLSLLSRSRIARESPWFKETLKKLDKYRKGDLYSFPRSMLRELGSGYWVSGRRMGLEENRRPSKAITAESTYRMLEIRSR